jgi:uncharacterized membrane protein HdeD (DUF308 family)
MRPAYDHHHGGIVELEAVMGINFTVSIILARLWWLFLLRGILGIVFGVLVLLVPGIGLIAVLALFAAWAIVGGATQLITAWRQRGQPNWWVGILEGLAGIAAGVLAILWPTPTAIALLFLVAAWAIAPACCRSGWRSGCVSRSAGSCSWRWLERYRSSSASC